MKKTIKLFGLFVVAAMTVIGCAKEVDAPEEATNETPTEQSTFTHTVTITAGAPTTKTVINEGETSASFKWSSDDATRFHVWENDVKGTAVTLTSEDEYETMKLTATFASVSAASYEYTAYLAKNEYDDDGDKYPQVPSEQTCTATSYDPNADILVAQPVTSVGSTLDEIEMKFGRPCVINKMTLKGLTVGETVSSVEIYADKPLTGYYDIDNTSWTGESRKITLTTSQVVPANGEVSVYFVTIPVSSAKLTVTAVTNAHVYNKTFGKTINFVLDQVTKFGVSSLSQYTKRDVLTHALTEIGDSGSYTGWSDISYEGSGHSSAVYAGESYPNTGGYIQIRNTSPSGIVSTTSGGAIQKIFVVFTSTPANTDGRNLSVYGKDMAYTGSVNLYGDAKGTKIDDITYSDGDVFGALSISSYYEFVGLLASKPMYFDEIDIFWGDGKSNSELKWTADGNSGDPVTDADASIETGDDTMPAAALYNPNGISLSQITFASSNTNVATIGEHTGVITLLGEGDTDISATFAGNATYKPATVKYTLSVEDNRSTVDTPSFSVSAGEVEKNTVVRISSNTADATVYYKVDSEPTTSSYDGVSTLKDASDKPYIDVTINEAKTIYAIAVKDDWKDSATGSAAYTVAGESTPLNAPTDVTITAMSSSSFNASWTASANASGYEWVLSTAANSGSIAAGNTKTSGTIDGGATVTLSKTGLTGDNVLSGKTPYFFYIKAKGSGAWTDSAYASDVKAYLIIDGEPLPSTKFTSATNSYNYYNNFAVSFTAVSGNGIGQFGLGKDAANYFANTSAIIIGKKDTYIHNTSAVPGEVTKFEMYQNKGGSSSVSIGINFSSYSISSYNSSSKYTYTATLSADTAYDCSSKLETGTKYFWFQVTNANNAQVQFRILYTPDLD